MNPLKCAFDITSSKILGCVVLNRGIEIDQAKVKSLQEMPEPKTLKVLQDLQGHLVCIRRFISNLKGCCRPFRHLTKKEGAI